MKASTLIEKQNRSTPTEQKPLIGISGEDFDPDTFPWWTFDPEVYRASALYPQQHPELLWYYRNVEGLTQEEIADKLDVSQSCISRWFNEHNLETREKSAFGSYDLPVKHGRWGQYPKFHTTYKGHEECVRIHSLLAIADGADPYEVFRDGTNVHHRVPIPSLNIPQNLEVMEDTEHSSLLHHGKAAGPEEADTLSDIAPLLDDTLADD